MFCKGDISEAEGASLGTFKDWGTHRAWKPCLEHTVTAILRMAFKHPSLSAPPYLTSLQPQSTHYCFLSSRQVTLVTVQCQSTGISQLRRRLPWTRPTSLPPWDSHTRIFTAPAGSSLCVTGHF